MTEKSFSEILKNLLHTEDRSPETPYRDCGKPPQKPTEWTMVFDWTQIHLHTKVSTPRPVKSPYPRRRRRPSVSTQPPKTPDAPTPTKQTPAPQKCFCFHQMTEDGQAAFRIWQGLGSLLSKDNLNLQILKKEYRRMAKDCHPDTHRGSDQRFRELKESHLRIERALQALETC